MYSYIYIYIHTHIYIQYIYIYISIYVYIYGCEPNRFRRVQAQRAGERQIEPGSGKFAGAGERQDQGEVEDEKNRKIEKIKYKSHAAAAQPLTH